MLRALTRIAEWPHKKLTANDAECLMAIAKQAIRDLDTWGD
jgi:hypothetical protein